VIVSENTPFFVDDKAGALAFLRYQPVEEVVGHDARGDVHDRRDVFAVDADVVLLFGVKRFAAGGFGNLNALRMAEPVGGMEASRCGRLVKQKKAATKIAAKIRVRKNLIVMNP